MINAMPDKTLEVFKYLKECAIKKRSPYYLDVYRATGVHFQHQDPQLNYICNSVCHPHPDLPCLSALVVKKKTGRPGCGFWSTHADVIAGDPRAWWREMVKRVHNYKYWSSVNLPDQDCSPSTRP